MAIHSTAVRLMPGRLTPLVRRFNARAVLDDVLRDPEAARRNATLRKSWVSIDEITQLANEHSQQCSAIGRAVEAGQDQLPARLRTLLQALPNATHDAVRHNDKPIVVEEVGTKPDRACRRMVENSAGMGFLLQNQDYTKICGDRTYFLTGDLARLERALIRYALDALRERGFRLVSVPDLLTADAIEACGMQAAGQRSQVYHVDFGGGGGDGDCQTDTKRNTMCLSGTAEIALANLFKGKDIPPAELPLKVCSVSRCYRAEVSTAKGEKGLYRVHQFNKVEMFGLTEGSVEKSQQLQREFIDIESTMLRELGLHFRLLDMPPADLARPAYRKFDIEAWMSGHGFYGEVASVSDCTAHQATRLGITSGGRYVHTVNGTACAAPRMLIAIGETYATSNAMIRVPKVLRPYLDVEELRPERAFRRWKYLPFYYFERRLLEEDSATEGDAVQNPTVDLQKRTQA